MRVNGQDIHLGETCTLQAFLLREGYVLDRVAVELDGAIVPKSAFETVVLKECDQLEIVSFVGGG
ncbi:MAG: sulfur carrier protein ThiS [Oscillospiraceae bacterium]|nr:sulfur carrier protein ThiS [Oscillospiraceae bacterium]